MFVADGYEPRLHNARMMDSKELLAALVRLKDAQVTTNADIARLLKLPTSRVAEIFAGTRQIKIDEMKTLVDRYGLADTPPTPSADSIDSILDAVLQLAPPGRLTDQSRRALAEAMSYGLGLLVESPSSRANADALGVAARAAASRFREKALTS